MIEVFFATNRATFDEGASPEEVAADPARFCLGRAMVEALGDAANTTEVVREILSGPEVLADQRGSRQKGDPDAAIDLWLDRAQAAGALPLLFIHGFANSFQSAITRAAQIAEFYAEAGTTLLPLVFCWPSGGVVVDIDRWFNPIGDARHHYFGDQVAAQDAGPVLAQLITLIAERSAQHAGPTPLLLAHSMGHLALVYGLQALRMPGPGRVFDQALLMAGDVQDNALEASRPLHRVAELAGRVTVGISFDSLLKTVSASANGNRRLGFCGPASLQGLPDNLVVLDCFNGLGTAAEQDHIKSFGGTSYNDVDHQYYRNARKVRADLAVVMRGGDPVHRVVLAPGQQLVAGRRRQQEIMLQIGPGV